MNFKILAINPGSTSTKIALYENEREVKKCTIEHPLEEIKKYSRISDQFDMRYRAVRDFLESHDFHLEELSAIVSRGGLLPPIKSGAYEINELMVDTLKNRPVLEHASNLGAMIAYNLAKEVGIPSYIYDGITVDELEDIARFTGVKDINRESMVHTLNMRAAAIKISKKLNRDYKELNLIVAHLGGGISLSLHSKGRMIDIVSDDEGPFSPERSGRVPLKSIVPMAYQYDKATMMKKLRGNSGLVDHLNTNSTKEVEDRIKKGDNYAKLVYEAMAYQVAKAIGELATVVCGEVDRIILTGGIANSNMFTEWVVKRVNFIAPVEIVPSENELEALSLGALRVLRGEEVAHVFK